MFPPFSSSGTAIIWLLNHSMLFQSCGAFALFLFPLLLFSLWFSVSISSSFIFGLTGSYLSCVESSDELGKCSLHFLYQVFFFISSISTWSFYSSISLLKIPFSLCILSTLCSKCFKILNLVVLKSLSDSFDISVTCKCSPIDCIFCRQQVGEYVFVPMSCRFLYYWTPDILWRDWGK